MNGLVVIAGELGIVIAFLFGILLQLGHVADALAESPSKETK